MPGPWDAPGTRLNALVFVLVSNMEKPSWCLVVKTKYVIPLRCARTAHSSALNSVGLNTSYSVE